jgi:DNA-binding CsgD family transcriptional regulator
MTQVSPAPAAGGQASIEDRPGARPEITLDRFGAIVESIYDTALDPANWSPCLELIRGEFAANFACLIVRAGAVVDLGLVVSAAGDRHDLLTYNPYTDMSPFSGLPTDKVVTVTDILSEASWRASQYYRDWCAPHDVFHVMAVDVAPSEGGVYGFRVTRPEAAPAFSGEDRDLCKRLLPHLKRALDLHLSINVDRQVSSLYSHAMAHLLVGVIILDEHGAVIECNTTGKAIVGMDDGLRIAGGQLEAAYANDNRKLQRLVRDALNPKPDPTPALIEAMTVSRPSGHASWGVVVQAMTPDQWTEGKHRPSVAVFIRDAEGKSEPPIRLAQQLFQLTPAETALSIQLANGLSLEEAAAALNIRRNTARAHLRSIFSKTGVRRQTELVRLFLNSVVLLGVND